MKNFKTGENTLLSFSDTSASLPLEKFVAPAEHHSPPARDNASHAPNHPQLNTSRADVSVSEHQHFALFAGPRVYAQATKGTCDHACH